MKIESEEAAYPMWVGDIHNDCILRLDFFELQDLCRILETMLCTSSGEGIPRAAAA